MVVFIFAREQLACFMETAKGCYSLSIYIYIYVYICVYRGECVSTRLFLFPAACRDAGFTKSALIASGDILGRTVIHA